MVEVNSNIELISSLLVAQKIIFVQSADQDWVDKLDLLLNGFRHFLSEFRKQTAVEECEKDLGGAAAAATKVEVPNTEDADTEFTNNRINRIPDSDDFRDEKSPVNVIQNVDLPLKETKQTNKPLKHSKKPKISNCALCKEQFRSKAELVKHDEEKHVIDGEFYCPFEACEKRVLRVKKKRGKENLEKHFFRIHSQSKSIGCNVCTEKFKSSYQLKDHFRRYHDEKYQLTCDICGKSIYTFTMKIHLATAHKIGKEMKCSQCEKLFLHKRLLNTHVRNAHENRYKYKCDQCDFRCAGWSLKTHLLTHAGEEAKVEVCTCGMKFKLKSQLRKHIELVHDQVKKAKCETCGKAFSTKSILIRHIKTHTGEKNFKCQHCEKCFIQKVNRDLHEKTHCNV